MCLAVPALVVAVDERGWATAVAGGAERAVSLAPLVLAGERVGPGDWVLLQQGLAVAHLTDDEVAALPPEPDLPEGAT